ncbi:AsmA family protein [Gelidibacter japonicus]|uniref:AsmA family protein n=1 Tax=Gelidibacter japonicus TaxID=1962232 RepID=UPI0013D36C89|nr:AsmA-like C-terminal region-containing protein [Gelidibacter japonicus]
MKPTYPKERNRWKKWFKIGFISVLGFVVLIIITIAAIINLERNRWKKWFKIGFISVLSFVVLISITIAVIINFIFTPEKLTPRIVDIVNENIEGEFYSKSTELTFFSSFPNFGVEITEGKLITQNDTLLLFGSCKAEFNLRKLLLEQIIDIKNVSLENASVNVLIDYNGKLNWDIFAFEKSEENESDFKINEFHINKFNLNKTAIRYENQQTNDLFSIDSLSSDFKMGYDDEKISAKLNSTIKKIKFIKEGFVLLDNTKAGIDTEVELFRKEHRFVFTKGGININGVDLLVNGFLQRDMITHKFETDLTLHLKVPDLKSVLDLVPEKIIQKEKININGEVDFITTVKGSYGKGEYPLTELKTSVRKGEFQYADYPGSINRIETDLRARLDFKDKKTSHFTIDNIDLEGFGISLKGNFSVRNLMSQPFLDTKLKGNVNITKLNEVIPFNPNITVQGNVDIDLATSFNINEIKQQDISSLALGGKAKLEEIIISIPNDSISLKVKQFNFDSSLEKKEVLTGTLKVNQMLLERIGKYIVLENLNMDFRLDRTLPENSVLFAKLSTGTIAYDGGAYKKAKLKGGEISVKLQSNREDRIKASIESDFTLDSLGVYYGKRFAGINGGKYKIKLQRNDLKEWTTYGGIHFNKMIAYSPTLGMPLRMEKATLTIIDKRLDLRNTKLIFGNSDVTLTGSIDNLPALISGIDKDEKITARLGLKSDYIDTNELMAALGKISKKTETIEKSPEEIIKQSRAETSEDKKIIEIPKNLDFVFNAHINKVKFGKTDIDQINGNIIIKDGKLKLSEAKMTTLAAELSTNLSYRYLNEKEADVRFEFNLNKIEMSRLSEFLPVLDSLFPMTKSFEGLVDFRVKGVSKIDGDMNFKTNTIKGVAAIEASNIMVFDSETFRDLAKTFMFKSKEKNPIEKLNIEMIISDSKLELLPSYLAIDRYELAIGGVQNLDMSYDYHISILKSPIPFKTGVDVKGNDLDNYKISLSKAKYKYYFTDSERLQKKADSTIINKKEGILKLLGFKE